MTYCTYHAHFQLNTDVDWILILVIPSADKRSLVRSTIIHHLYLIKTIMKFSCAAALLLSSIFITASTDAFQPVSSFSNRKPSAFVNDNISTFSTTSLNEGNPFQSIMDVFQPKEEPVPDAPKLPDVVIEPNYNLALGSGLLGALIVAATPGK